MVDPYYDRDGITIYHADCRDVLPNIDPDDVDLLLTDPPYGINYKPGWNRDTNIIGDDQPFDPRELLTFGDCVIWGAA